MGFDAKIPELQPAELKALLSGGIKKLFLLDVREPDEYDICKIEGATLIPLMQLFNRIEEVPKGQSVIVYCHHGGRSARAVSFLLERGFDSVKNLTGGIDLWAEQVEPGMRRY